MTGNRAGSTLGPRTVKVEKLDYPKLVDPRGTECDHGVIIKLVTTNICGSDQHIYRGRFPAPRGWRWATRTPASCRDGPRRRVHQEGRLGLGPVQRRMWTLPQLQGAAHRHLSQRQPRDRLRGLRVQPRRLAGRAGRIYDGPLRRFPAAEVSRPGPGDGEDPRPHTPLGLDFRTLNPLRPASGAGFRCIPERAVPRRTLHKPHTPTSATVAHRACP